MVGQIKKNFLYKFSHKFTLSESISHNRSVSEFEFYKCFLSSLDYKLVYW